MSIQMRKVLEQILKTNRMTFEDLKQLGYLKVLGAGNMDLHIDYLGKKFGGWDTYSLAHNYKQQGDVMADPDMEFLDDSVRLHPITFQQNTPPLNIFQRAMEETNDGVVKYPRIIRSLVTFANQWAKNLRKQGFTKAKAERKEAKTE